jgi:broad specificity phosphatase PhoE
MNKRQIIIARHGETEDNHKGVFRTSKTKLTEKGKKQAEDLGKALAGKNITKIYSSDLPRAVETSKIINKYL